MEKVVTTGELAEFLGVATWRIRRPFEDRTLPEPPRIGGRRVIPTTAIPEIIERLRARQWLPGATDLSDSAEAEDGDRDDG